MINFKEIDFGCADANTEAERTPERFKEVFFDPNNHLDELISGDRFILQGRKGDGKSAYSAEIRLIAEEKGIYADQRSLNNFNNITFEQIKTYQSFGGNPYISFWKCILAIECVAMINRFEPHIQHTDYVTIVDALVNYGFIANGNDISVTVAKLVETDSTLNLKGFFNHRRKHEYQSILQGADQIFSSIRDAVKDVYVDRKFVMIIDGLDDLLNNSEFKPEVITGLIRAAEEINRVFKGTTLKIKILVLIRNDILNLCRDPNLSKIVRDFGIRLSWSIVGDPFDSDLLCLVSKRVDIVTNRDNSLRDVWKEVFPETVGARSSIDYLLDNIIYRPRDILQLLTELQKEFVRGRKLSVEKVLNALSRYSDEYFIDAMRDELTGFFPDDVVTQLPDILSKMGTREFYLSDFEEECNNYPAFSDVSKREMLERLFVAGYIGQHRPRENKDYTVFSYRNSRERFLEEDECILHRGLMRALTI